MYDVGTCLPGLIPDVEAEYPEECAHTLEDLPQIPNSWQTFTAYERRRSHQNQYDAFDAQGYLQYQDPRGSRTFDDNAQYDEVIAPGCDASEYYHAKSFSDLEFQFSESEYLSPAETSHVPGQQSHSIYHWEQNQHGTTALQDISPQDMTRETYTMDRIPQVTTSNDHACHHSVRSHVGNTQLKPRRTDVKCTLCGKVFHIPSQLK